MKIHIAVLTFFALLLLALVVLCVNPPDRGQPPADPTATTLTLQEAAPTAEIVQPIPTADVRTPVIETPTVREPIAEEFALTISMVPPQCEGCASQTLGTYPGYTLVLLAPNDDEIHILQVGVVAYGADLAIERYLITINGSQAPYDTMGMIIYPNVSVISKGFVSIRQPMGWRYYYEPAE